MSSAGVAAVQRLLGCNVYISEGRNIQLVRRLEALCRQHPRAVVLAHTFIDDAYNRTGLTLTANSIPELAATVLTVAQHALAHIDLSSHQAQHPRLGVVDHVSLHPLGPDASLSLAAQAATAIGQQLSQPPLQLPVYYYGAAHATGCRRLAEIRRNLGYFKPTSSSSSWSGSISQLQLGDHYPPDAGPHTATAAAGVVTVGAVPWVTNFNIPLYTQDMAAAKAVARALSTKGGGLPGVEAMALPHGPGVIEVATNLIAYDWRHQDVGAGNEASTAVSSSSSSSSSEAAGAQQPSSSMWSGGAGPIEVAAAVAQLAQQHGLPPPGPGYITNKTPPQMIATTEEQLLSLA